MPAEAGIQALLHRRRDALDTRLRGDDKERSLMNLIYVAIGGAIGSVMRYLMQNLIGHLTGMAFPYGTLIVNISGSVLMGVFIGWLTARTSLTNAHDIRLFVAVGILGGYTTFSSFSLDAIVLMEEGKWMAMAMYVLSSVLLSLGGLLLGLRLMRVFA
jgi:CrcB protein